MANKRDFSWKVMEDNRQQAEENKRVYRQKMEEMRMKMAERAKIAPIFSPTIPISKEEEAKTSFDPIEAAFANITINKDTTHNAVEELILKNTELSGVKKSYTQYPDFINSSNYKDKEAIYAPPAFKKDIPRKETEEFLEPADKMLQKYSFKIKEPKLVTYRQEVEHALHELKGLSFLHNTIASSLRSFIQNIIKEQNERIRNNALTELLFYNFYNHIKSFRTPELFKQLSNNFDEDIIELLIADEIKHILYNIVGPYIKETNIDSFIIPLKSYFYKVSSFYKEFNNKDAYTYSIFVIKDSEFLINLYKAEKENDLYISPLLKDFLSKYKIKDLENEGIYMDVFYCFISNSIKFYNYSFKEGFKYNLFYKNLERFKNNTTVDTSVVKVKINDEEYDQKVLENIIECPLSELLQNIKIETYMKNTE